VTSDEIHGKAQAALAGSRYQLTLPRHEETNEPEDRRRAKSPLDREGGGSDVAIPAIGAGAFLTQVIFVVLLVAAGLLLVGWIGREVLERRRRSAAAPSSEEDAAAASAPALNLSFEDASRLAAEGRYAEAVHALLLAAIRYFAERTRTAVQPSRTSRELVRVLPLGPETREAFSELVRTVELSLFGGAEVGPEDYERSLARFQALTRRPA
jgi:hypothetical protein